MDEAEGFECWLVNAREVKNVPGRAKTDKADAVWLAKVAERGMCRASLVHPKPIRELCNLTRYRRSLIRDRTREMQRVEKLLEDAQIKITSVVSDVFGVSGRAILHALIDGQRDPAVLAGLAVGRLRPKTAQLREALRGFFTDHHATILAMMLDNIDRLSAQITALDTTIGDAVDPFAHQVAQLGEITGAGRTAAQELIAELGVDMTRFPSDAHLVSWAKFCPQTRESAGKTKNKGRAKGSPWLAATLGNIAASACRTDTFLGARHRRIAKRRGTQKAIVATGNAVLVIAYHLLADPAVRYHDLGADHYDTRINKHRRARNLATQLQALTGQKITIRDGKPPSPDPRPQTRIRRALPPAHPSLDFRVRRQSHHRLTTRPQTRPPPGPATCPPVVGFSGPTAKPSSPDHPPTNPASAGALPPAHPSLDFRV